MLVLGALSLSLGRADLDNLTLRSTLLRLRGIRLVAAFMVGAALAVGGVIVQGLFRNPLVSPSILGTTGGASLGGQLAIIGLNAILARQLFHIAPELILPFGCLGGALIALFILLVVGRVYSGPLVFLLVGFTLSSLFLAAGALATSIAQDSWDLGRAVVAFTLGGLGGVGKQQVLMALPLTIFGIIAAWFWGRSIDLLLSGEEEAASLGVNVAQVRRWGIIWTALLTAAAVSLCGNIGFVGLVVPHALRPWIGANHRRLIPVAALAGGTFLVACDLLTRILPGRTHVPLGVVTGLVGAPLFLLLILKQRRELLHG
ncbi:MAG: iron ABC transporter permease [Deltaproteobacteria bacterium]|nr:iron ABC transporter permease [Deltaproteobacteria bacterium]